MARADRPGVSSFHVRWAAAWVGLGDVIFLLAISHLKGFLPHCRHESKRYGYVEAQSPVGLPPELYAAGPRRGRSNGMADIPLPVRMQAHLVTVAVAAKLHEVCFAQDYPTVP